MARKKIHQNQTFPVIIQKDETGGFVVTNPSLEGCYSQGETIEEALNNIKEATELCLEELKEPLKSAKVEDISLHFISLNKQYV